MSDRKLKFGDKKIRKREFYDNKEPFEIDNTDVNKIMVSEKKLFDSKKNHIDIILDMMIIILLGPYL